MKKPLLIVVTGRPASGKTTLAHVLAKEIKCPLLSRDELKEGYLNTIELHHNELSDVVNRDIYETFFQAIELLISKGISIIIEAAFQHKLWEPGLSHYLNKAEVRIIICTINHDIAKSRFINRVINDPGREKYHGEKLVGISRETASLIEQYETLEMPAPTLQVDTTNEYIPGIREIINFIK